MRNQSSPIGSAVRSRRADLHLSQRDLARVAGTTAAAVSHIERGIREPSAGLLARLAAALQCSADELLVGAAATSQESPCIPLVLAAMRTFPHLVQAEVVEFCEYLKCRDRKRCKAQAEPN